LARNALVRQTGLPYHSFLLDRTEKGKPFLVNCPPLYEQYDFNISHDGDYAVVATELQHLVGVDTVQVDRPRMLMFTILLQIYTVPRRKGVTLFSTITLAFLGRFLQFLYRWKKNEYSAITCNLLTLWLNDIITVRHHTS